MDPKKLLAFLALLACLQPGICLYGQQPPPLISLSEKNAPLKKILDIIEKKTGYTVFGDATWSQHANKVTINVDSVPVEQALEICFRNQPLEYQLSNSTINIRVMDYVQGRTVNVKGEPVPSATIQVRGVNWHAISNDSGGFRIQVPSKNAVLIISSISYEPQELHLTGTNRVTVQLNDRMAN
jgi:hypothetical protein